MQSASHLLSKILILDMNARQGGDWRRLDSSDLVCIHEQQLDGGTQENCAFMDTGLWHDVRPLAQQVQRSNVVIYNIQFSTCSTIL